MRGMLAVLSVNVARAKGRPGYVVMSVLLTVGAIVAAVLISSVMDERGTIAYVSVPAMEQGMDPAVGQVTAVNSPTLERRDAITFGALEQWFRIEFVPEVPPVSQLMRNRYDAIVVENDDGGFNIVTVKGDEFRAQLGQLLSAPDVPATDGTGERGVGTTIVGFLIMFVLISGSAFMNFFSDDKRTGTFRRTVTSPVSIRMYLAGQLLFNGLMLFVPVMGVLVALKEVFRVDIGFSYPHYGVLIGLVSALATFFGFFIASAIENPDDGMAVSGTVIIVTSLLGGSFFAFEHTDPFMQFVTGLLPQRSLMQLASALEQGLSVAEFWSSAGHVLILSLGLGFVGWIICERRFRAGNY